MAENLVRARRQRFEQLVDQAQRDLVASPQTYKLKVALLALLGYGVLLAAIVLLAGLLGGVAAGLFLSSALFVLLIKKKLIFVIGAGIWMLTRAVFVRIPAPQGYRITRHATPRLFELIDALRKQMAAPRIHQVLLTADYNAGIARTPRLGLLGFPRVSLVLGLPLMLDLSPDQFHAVLAHEFGHLSGNHGRFNNWIYRVRVSFERIREALEGTQSWAARLFGRFFHWYSPYFAAYSFALARSNEYEADATAAAATSSQALGSALARTHVSGAQLEQDYWEALYRRADDVEAPDVRPFAGLRSHIKQHPPTATQAQLRLRHAMAEETGHADTHPALKDRLGAIGVAPEIAELPSETAAEHYLDTALSDILTELDLQWAEHYAVGWKQRYEHVRQSRKELVVLEQKLEQKSVESLSDEELWNLAAWTEEFKAPADPLPLYRQFLARHPESPYGLYALGRILLERADESGIAHLEQSMAEDELVVPACELCFQFCSQRGDAQAADRYWEKAEEQIHLEECARRERATLGANAAFLPSQLPAEWAEHLAVELRARNAKEAWIARVEVAYLPQEPLYVLAFKLGGCHWNADDTHENLLDIEFPGECFLLPLNGRQRRLAKKVRKVGERIL